ncbi:MULTISPECIES: formyl transferase [Mumia]|uniref:glucosamine inositolphosphorylceramide transferase family protein n=1 Tax=Mumia TaxID=1546255 RepID=UPI001422A332|nr:MULTISPECIES: formyl transferase [unclassified Mumia]QMW67125.1 formyl transferase [Mumia sp. ZJ1417]
MHVQILLRRDQVRHWHHDLVAALDARSEVDAVTVAWVTGSRDPDPRLERLLRADRVLHRLPAGRWAGVAPGLLDARGTNGDAAPDVTLDLVEAGRHDGVRTLGLTFDGHPGDDALLAALTAGRLPVVAVVDRADGRTVASGRPGSELPGLLPRALDDVLAGVVTIIVAAVTDRGVRVDGATNGTAANDAVQSWPRRVATTTAHAGIHGLYRRLYRAPHWRVGWRFVDEGADDVLDLGTVTTTPWNRLPDDGYHFYADPFPLLHDGRHHLFVEDFDHRVGRGVVSVVEMTPEGPTGTPYPVLERPYHLSYPWVGEDEGELWMIPESSAAGTLELYRAVAYPDRWEHVATLLEGAEISDATPFHHDGRWWMTATVRHGGSFSDTLHLWHADRLRGPWTPHAANPVLVDIATARPAGRVVERDGRLLRPVQDGRTGYGAALALAEITRLDDTAFEQRHVASLAPGGTWGGSRLHTLNRAGRLECIDGSARSPRIRRRPAAERT